MNSKATKKEEMQYYLCVKNAYLYKKYLDRCSAFYYTRECKCLHSRVYFNAQQYNYLGGFMSQVIHISFSDVEYSEIENIANGIGISVMQYAKGRILSEGEFQKRYNELLNAVGDMRSGTHFNIKAVFGLQWAAIPRGTRLALGKEFYKQVASMGVPHVSATCKDSSHTQWYQKVEAEK
jgi:hypothetical protein